MRYTLRYESANPAGVPFISSYVEKMEDKRINQKFGNNKISRYTEQYHKMNSNVYRYYLLKIEVS